MLSRVDDAFVPLLSEQVDRWRGVYEVDIMSGVAPGMAHNVLGGQISAWGEAMSDANINELIWKTGGRGGRGAVVTSVDTV